MKRVRLAPMALCVATISFAALAESNFRAVPSGPSIGPATLVSDRTGRRDGNAKVNLTHEAIPAIGWPGMTMDMPLLEGARIRGVKPGDQAWFVFAIGPDGAYAIKEIAPKTGPKPAAPAGAVVTEGVVNAMP